MRERIDFIFATFLRVKSIHGVVRELASSRLLLPRRERGRDDAAVVWRRPTAAAVSSLLRNPAYAGTFVYGRTRFVPRVPGGPPRKHPLPPEQWQFMVPDKYPAYIDRETFAAIQAILRDNYQEYDRRRSRGVARSGSALLQGLAYCGHCGRKMTVQYQAAARYLCCGHKEQGGGRECQRIPITPVDARVVQSFWEALAPAELDRYDAAVAALDDQRRQIRRARDLQLERLRYEARLAEKQYQLVDPENRLVASELERRWEQALRAVRQAEEESRVEEAEIEPVTEELRRQLDEVRPDAAADVGRRLAEQRPEEGAAADRDRQGGAPAAGRGPVRDPDRLEGRGLDDDRPGPAGRDLRRDGRQPGADRRGAAAGPGRPTRSADRHGAHGGRLPRAAETGAERGIGEANPDAARGPQAEDGVPAIRRPRLAQHRPGGHATGRVSRLGLPLDPAREARRFDAIRSSAST